MPFDASTALKMLLGWFAASLTGTVMAILIAGALMRQWGWF